MTELMEFLHEPIWWILGALCTITASIPAKMRSIGKAKALVIMAIWLALCVVTLLRFGVLPALATTLISGIWGVMLMIASLIFSGIKSMPNQRFEER